MTGLNKMIVTALLLVLGNSAALAAPPVIKFPPPETGTGPTTTKKPLPVVRGRCVFPSVNILANLLRVSILDGYQKVGWKNVASNVRIILPRTEATVLAFTSIEGITKFGGKGAGSLQLNLEGGTEANPVEIGCAMEARVETVISAEGTDGKRVTEKSTSTIIVRGVFN